MTVELMPHQEEVLDRLSSGKILHGGVGSGKSITALVWYLRNELIGDIYVITTAKKRDSLEWERDAAKLGIGPEHSLAAKLHVDSWNNIGKYTEIKG
ncbi:DEAD/DEAH box helicase family protein, partial [Leclercia adecarboxylata]